MKHRTKLTAEAVGLVVLGVAAAGTLAWFQHKMLDGVEPRGSK